MNRQKDQESIFFSRGIRKQHFSIEGAQMEISPKECLSSWHQALA